MTVPAYRRDTSRELTDADFESLDESEWADFTDWWARRTCAGTYTMAEFSAAAFITRMAWLRKYTLRLRARMRESRSVEHLRKIEAENKHLSADVRRLQEAPDSIRVNGLRRALEACHKEMRRWGLAVPSAGEFDGRG